MSSRPGVDILMYHSISDGPGPTCIPPAIFREQLDVLADCGYRAASLAGLDAWLRGGAPLAERTVILTFDDGFADFATTAFPAIQARGWSATVFVPAGKMGGWDDWEPPGRRRRLLDPDTVATLARAGVDFGGHGMSHVDLTRLAPDERLREIAGAREVLEALTGRRVVAFAPPFGRTTAEVRREVEHHYRLAAGTRLARAGPASDPYDLPRIEMWYFRNPRRWRAYLRSPQTPYFALRRVLRWLRSAVRWT